MSRSLAALLGGLVVVAACAEDPVAPTEIGPAPNFNQGREAPLHGVAKGRIPNEYIVVLNDGANPDSVVAATGKAAKHIYRSVINGFAVTLSQGEVLAAVRNGSFRDQVSGVVVGTPNLLVGTQVGVCNLLGVDCRGAEGEPSFPDTGSLTDIGGEYAWYLSGPGVQRIWLRGTPGTNFDLYYDEWNGSAWIQKAAKTTASTNEFLQYTSTCGGAATCYKRARVRSVLGTGTFNLWFDRQ